MASKQQEHSAYATHHRMHLSLSEMLAATDRTKWRLRKFGFMRENKWLEAPYNDNVQAFEEKFDGSLMASSRSPVGEVRSRLQDVTALGESILVRNDRQRYTGAWYVGEPKEHVGVAAFKAFGQEGAPGTYTFELMRIGTADELEQEEDERADARHLQILKRQTQSRPIFNN